MVVYGHTTLFGGVSTFDGLPARSVVTSTLPLRLGLANPMPLSFCFSFPSFSVVDLVQSLSNITRLFPPSPMI
jgi:hypothetical protein